MVHHVRFIAAGSALLFALAGCASADSSSAGDGEPTSAATPAEAPAASPTAVPSPTTVQYRDRLTGTTLTNEAICTDYSAVLDEYEGITSRRLAKLEEKSSDAYSAASLVNNATWIDEDLGADFENAIAVIDDGALTLATGGNTDGIDDTDAFAAAAIAECGLTSRISQVREQVSEVSSKAAEISALASQRPWYPKGFFEITEGFAGKWIRGASDPCGYGPRCTYWTLDVVGENGCPSSVYVEVNFTRNGSVVDWGNDSLPSLNSMQKGRLQFYTYDLPVDSIQIADVSCF